jgi:ABC-type glutathione transport system ATPase component
VSRTADRRRTDHGAGRDRAAQILLLLKKLQQRLGMSLLLISHDLNLVRRSRSGCA